MFDNRERLYTTCPDCAKRSVLVKNWHGPRPTGGVLCECGTVLLFARFIHAFTGARWADRWYKLQQKEDEVRSACKWARFWGYQD